MNILILGATGYLGSKITEYLANAEDCHIVCTARRESLNRCRLENINKIKIVPTSTDAIETVLNYEKIDVILNMITNYGRSNMLYDGVIEANVEMPLNILNIAANMGVGKFITIGTGLPDELNMYSFSKNILSEFGKFYSEKNHINFTEIKLEMFYGYDEPLTRFLPGTIDKMLRGETVNTTIGTQHRDIIAVQDVLSAIRIIVNDKSLSGYNVIPVGSGISPSISEIINYIWEETGKKSRINFGAVPMRENEPDCIAYLTKIKEIAPEWEPIFWKRGISEMIIKMKERVDVL